jgi:hypothetical protein
MLMPFEERCQVCGTELVPCTGRLIRAGEREWYRADAAITPLQSSHRPARSVNALPFVQQGVTFAGPGSIYFAARVDMYESVDSLIRETLAGGLMIGGGRTRGMGAMRAELVPRPDPALTTHTRIAAFNQALRAELRFYAIMASGTPGSTGQLHDDGTWYFTLDVADMQLASDRQPDPLAAVKALRDVRTVRRWISVSAQDGRNTATGKRSGALQLMSGTFLCRAAPDADRAALEQTLAYLETHGIGIGGERGYGSAIVCDPFHLESDPL